MMSHFSLAALKILSVSQQFDYIDCILVWLCLGLSYLEFIEVFGFVNSCILSNLGSFWSLFI